MTETTPLLWFILAVMAAGAITVDVLLHRRGKVSASPRAALVETFAWIALALIFDLWVLHVKGRQSSVEFLTGYLIEKSLSIDNIFLFLVIFRSFRIGLRRNTASFITASSARSLFASRLCSPASHCLIDFKR